MRLSALGFGTVLVLGGCEERGERHRSGGLRDSTVVTRFVRSDTVLLEITGAGTEFLAQEVLRTSNVSPEVMFGSVEEIAAMPDGGVVAFDAKSQHGLALQQFDANGKHVRTIGRQGRGPGEYATWNVNLAVARDGTILLRDQLRDFILWYDSTGRFRRGRRFSSSGTRSSFMLASDTGGAFIRQSDYEGTRTYALLLDTLRSHPDTVELNQVWAQDNAFGALASRASGIAPNGTRRSVLSDGSVLVTHPDKLGYVLLPASGEAPLFVIVKDTAIGYLPEERTDLQRVRDYTRRQPRELPARKPLTTRALTDIDGRI